ncbi:hypothetical protein HCH44_17175 [Sphingomonas melonis]|uniref:hypothetical protein n=1 Tax=Sphingomonas melonis TaxID=152682 RepID=UPI001C8B1FDF|nr:hypothetical protein [Sphingomonas melonis]MBX8846634.1 hypothetical protein [Sphingomonas melonis]MBX8855777.1 hypothetical protein [Sphingomonas melonis]MBX8900733.1 hypothetical protein [Sphingomonas melonis]
MDTLLISPDFFGYPQEIVRALAARGRSALWCNDRPASDTLTKALVRLSPKIIERKSAEHFEQVFREAAQYDIRDVVVIKGEALSIDMIRRMRQLLPRARHTLYFWDSYRNMPAGTADKVDLFDRAFSFDLEDVRNDGRLSYRPLFYIEQYADLNHIEQDIDLLFIGTAHSDRVNVLRRIAAAMPADFDFRRILFARSPLLHRIQNLVSKPYRLTPESDFIFKPMSKSEVQTMIGRTRAVLDIERAIQTGFTMRTIEMLGAGRKLITTNPSIMMADFYHPQNQYLIDRDNPVIDPDFLKTPWHPISNDLTKKYSLSDWLDTLFG